ncbi:putative lipoprotein [Campylobacter jejuni subsp. jejuni 1997-1]|nr:YcfL family protein [Campylobacter jejuni]EIB51387.1 putative lipoprotein [Campylobacter jejuni subsp. jejuni 1997-1]MDK2137758.1 YcfL family protein [Campylobacter jejuni]MDV6021417.1 YcfL family protein [Campylobacter jejuni]MDV6047104.1 YcfL family protein [Campylobacter jejuni]MDV6127586.1 YcfL family protein [Campylobacter jejuni]
MKKIILFILMFLLSACAPSYQINSNQNTVILGSNLPKSLVKQFQKRINSNGYLEFEVILRSTFAKDVIYKVDWLDKDGFVLRDVLNEDYQALRIPAGQEVILRKLASDTRAKDFRLEIKAKNNLILGRINHEKNKNFRNSSYWSFAF